MSRALSKDVVNLLKNSDPLPAYKAISAALTQTVPDGKLLEIEILPATHVLAPGTHLLQDENAVAVSKLALLQAFTVARSILEKHLKQIRGQAKDDGQEDILGATAVILLTDAEHLTAANTRKRTLLATPPSDLGPLVDREKSFIDSLLTSCLHRHTKSPTLWTHRRWLVQLQASSSSTRSSTPDDIVRNDIVEVVMRAGERHPRNYYAWSHARWLVESYLSRKSREDESTTTTSTCYEEILTATKKWCYRHHADISGWSFLYFLLLVHAPSRPTDTPSPTEKTLSEVLDLASSLRWTNESVWVFLRSLAAAGEVSSPIWEAFVSVNRTMRTNSQPESDQGKILLRAEEWASTFRPQMQESNGK